MNTVIGNEDKFYASPEPPDPIFDIPFAGISYPNPLYMKRRDIPVNMFVFEYVIRGRGYLSSEGGSVALAAGDLYVINTKFPQYYYADRDDPFEKIWVNTSGTLVESLTSVYGLDKPFTVRHGSEAAYPLFERVYRTLRDGSLTKAEAFGRVSLVLHEIMLFMRSPSEITKNNPSAGKAEAIRSYLDRAVYSSVRLADLAKIYFVTPNHLIRLFRQAFGITPKQYLLDKKLETADKLLANTDFSIDEISAALAFSSPQHLCATYRRRRGRGMRGYGGTGTRGTRLS